MSGPNEPFPYDHLRALGETEMRPFVPPVESTGEAHEVFESFADYLNAVTETVVEPTPVDDSDDFVTPVVAVPSIRPPTDR